MNSLKGKIHNVHNMNNWGICGNNFFWKQSVTLKSLWAVWLSSHYEKCDSQVIMSSVTLKSLWEVWLSSHYEQCDSQVIMSSVTLKSLWAVWLSSHYEKCDSQVIMRSVTLKSLWEVWLSSHYEKCDSQVIMRSVTLKSLWEVWLCDLSSYGLQFSANHENFVNLLHPCKTHGTSLKKTPDHMRTRTCIAGLSQQTLCSRPSYIPKKGCIKSGVKQHCLFPFVQY